jgi:hypothetical protein
MLKSNNVIFENKIKVIKDNVKYKIMTDYFIV